MFQSCDYKYLDYDQEKGQYRYEITIVDDDFTETTSSAAAAASVRAASAAAAAATTAIEIYSRRNLNVAQNLWLLYQYQCERYPYWAKYVLSDWQNYVPAFKQYEEDIAMYLTFS
jgi:hypothetical protein